MELAEKLKLMRKKAGLTQKEVADKLGITYQSYGQYERGLRNPKYTSIEKIASALNCDISEILTPAEAEKMFIGELVENLLSGKKDSHPKQNEAEAKTEGLTDEEYAVYLMNLLIEHAALLSIFASGGYSIRFETLDQVIIMHDSHTKSMTTNDFLEQFKKLYDTLNDTFDHCEILNLQDSNKDGE